MLSTLLVPRPSLGSGGAPASTLTVFVSTCFGSCLEAFEVQHAVAAAAPATKIAARDNLTNGSLAGVAAARSALQNTQRRSSTAT